MNHLDTNRLFKIKIITEALAIKRAQKEEKLEMTFKMTVKIKKWI